MDRQDQSNAFDSLVQMLAEQGFDGLANAIQILMNEAMKLQRAEALQAQPYERTDERRGYANGGVDQFALQRPSGN